jgi:hypothetical protein
MPCRAEVAVRYKLTVDLWELLPQAEVYSGRSSCLHTHGSLLNRKASAVMLARHICYSSCSHTSAECNSTTYNTVHNLHH